MVNSCFIFKRPKRNLKEKGEEVNLLIIICARWRERGHEEKGGGVNEMANFCISYKDRVLRLGEG